jgi:Rad3-related DNA helicase
MIPKTPRAAGVNQAQWYGPQLQALEWFDRQNEKVLFLDAPTASGKTFLIKGLHALTQQKVYAGTWTRALQEQHSEMLNIPKILGRGNFRCNKEDDTCDWGYCQDDSCPFVQQLKVGQEAPITTLNYAVLMQYLSKLQPRPWLVCDEGHKLEDALDNYLQIEISRIWYEDIDFPIMPPDSVNPADLREWARKVKETTMLPVDRKQAMRWERAKNTAFKAAAATEEERIWTDNGYEITSQVLWPLTFFPAVLSAFQRVLIMSATLGDMDTLAKSMGLRDDYATLALGSTIPENNRLIHVKPRAFLKRGCTALDIASVANDIMYLAEEVFPGQRGLVHVSSYELARKLGTAVANAGLGTRSLWEQRNSPGVREQWANRLDAPVLTTPAAALGLDLPYLFGWQVIAKCPLPDLGNPAVRARANADHTWYDRRSSDGVVQMAGRVVRTPQDNGVTVITCPYFKKLMKRTPNSFPKWFKQALRY